MTRRLIIPDLEYLGGGFWNPVGKGRVRFEPMELPAPLLPNFKRLLDDPPKWRERRK